MLSQVLPQPKPANTLQKIHSLLLAPHPSIIRANERRNAQLLIYFAFIVFVLAARWLFAINIPNILTNPDDQQQIINLAVSFVSTSVILTIYAAARSSKYRWGGVMLLMFLYLLGCLVIFGTTTDLTTALANLQIFCLAALMASIFLNYKPFILFACACILTTSLAIVLAPEAQTSLPVLLVDFNMVTIFLIIFTNHRNKIESDRRAELSSANDALRVSEAALEQRVIERTHELEVAKKEAEFARERAEKADMVKSQFLASMSHELRTPLNAILTFNQLMAMGSFGAVNSEQEEFLNQSLNSGRHLLSLINDVLDVTKIQSGMMQLFIEKDFDIARELESVAAAAEKMLEGKSVKLVLDIDYEFPLLMCDKRRIRQVLLNLVSNAVKFTETGTITLCAKKEQDKVLFAVLDTGPGISPEDQVAIFEPFTQTETGITHVNGTGLGLPITRSLVEAHGGEIYLESASGEGAAFYVRLPVVSNLEPGEVEI
jgi:signal transduction histidine kinase